MLLLIFSSVMQTTKYFAEQWMYMGRSLCVNKPAELMSLNHSVRRVSWSPMSDHHNDPLKTLKVCFALAAFIQWPGYMDRFAKSNRFSWRLKFWKSKQILWIQKKTLSFCLNAKLNSMNAFQY